MPVAKLGTYLTALITLSLNNKKSPIICTIIGEGIGLGFSFLELWLLEGSSDGESLFSLFFSYVIYY